MVDPVSGQAEFLRLFAGEILHFADIGPRNERLFAFPGDDQAADFAFFSFLQRLLQVGKHLGVRDDPDFVVLL